MRRGGAASGLALAAALAGCGGGTGRPDVGAGASTSRAVPAPGGPEPHRTSGAAAAPTPPRPALPRTLSVRWVGEGTRGAWVIRRRASAHDPVVVFLHGWTAADPRFYGPWLTHLAREGRTVVYPVYQSAPFLNAGTAFGNVVAGVRAALAQARPRLGRSGWVVAGHSAGGAMSADYAVRAAALGLPPARGVFAAYPGRMIRHIPLRLPEADPSGIPAATRLVVLYSPRDETVGATTALRTYRRATRVRFRTLVRVTQPSVQDHRGPQRAGPVTRAVFWRRLDRLLRQAG